MKEKFKCLQCGDEFEADKFWARYCSGKCRVRAHYYRAKEKAAGKKSEEPAPLTPEHVQDTV